ncbi:MAG: hypothetical protein ABH951_01720 [Patescibacteria group bacterium]
MANSQTVRINDSIFITVNFENTDLSAVRAWEGLHISEKPMRTEVGLSNISIGPMYLSVYGEFIEDYFRPKLAWVDVPDGYVDKFPSRIFSSGNRLNVSQVCGNTVFLRSFYGLLSKMMGRSGWQIQSITEKVDQLGQAYTINKTHKNVDRFVFPGQEDLALRGKR